MDGRMDGWKRRGRVRSEVSRTAGRLEDRTKRQQVKGRTNLWKYKAGLLEQLRPVDQERQQKRADAAGVYCTKERG